MGDLADQRPMTVKVSIRAKTVKDCQFLRRLLVQELCRVLDNFHGGHCFVDDWLGCGFWTSRDAIVACSGNDLSFDEPGFQAHIFELKSSGDDPDGCVVQQISQVILQ